MENASGVGQTTSLNKGKAEVSSGAEKEADCLGLAAGKGILAQRSLKRLFKLQHHGSPSEYCNNMDKSLLKG